MSTAKPMNRPEAGPRAARRQAAVPLPPRPAPAIAGALSFILLPPVDSTRIWKENPYPQPDLQLRRKRPEKSLRYGQWIAHRSAAGRCSDDEMIFLPYFWSPALCFWSITGILITGSFRHHLAKNSATCPFRNLLDGSPSMFEVEFIPLEEPFTIPFEIAAKVQGKP